MKALNSYRTKNRNLETGVEMEKYSVLLVDDEEDVIQIIMKKMDCSGSTIPGWHGMKICGSLSGRRFLIVQTATESG